MEKQLTNDKSNETSWVTAMNEFNAMTANGKVPLVAQALEWKERHVNKNTLTFRQKDAIIGRYNSIADGSFGKSKDGIKMLDK